MITASELEHLSYSSISAYLACGAAWKYHYLDQIKTPTNPDLLFGSAFHGAVESYIGDGHQGDIHQVWREQWNKQVETNADVCWDEPQESYHNLGVRMLESETITRGILSIEAAAIERRVELRVPGVPIPIVGYIDVITQDGIPGDFKTSAKAWTPDRAVNEMQPVFYLAALNQAGEAVPGGKFRHYIFTKTKTPQFQEILHSHSAGEMLWLLGMIRRVWEGIERGVYAMNPMGWKCSPTYCDYWRMCRGKHA